VTTVAYLANQFPSPVEPYVFEEIEELRRRAVQVVPCSARRHGGAVQELRLESFASETLYLQPLSLGLLIRAAWLCLRRFTALSDLLTRALAQGSEPPARRLRALLHTLLGACLALRLEGRGVEHIHVHHGYFASWIAMVAARLLGIDYSLTLHGSDLLLHGAYLDTKLKHCGFCVTVSEFNRRFVLEHYPDVEPGKIIVQRLGVQSPCTMVSPSPPGREPQRLTMLAVGRLHPVKDHAFLLRACYELKSRGTDFSCLIAGEGPERPWLEHLIRNLGLERQVNSGPSLPAATRCLLRVVRLGRAQQSQRGHSAGPHGSHGAMQDRAGARDYGNSGTGEGWRDRVPVSRRLDGRLPGQNRNYP
jgi:colanic acid/amylovoran biosynthesis glycosyltransferase